MALDVEVAHAEFPLHVLLLAYLLCAEEHADFSVQRLAMENLLGVLPVGLPDEARPAGHLDPLAVDERGSPLAACQVRCHHEAFLCS